MSEILDEQTAKNLARFLSMKRTTPRLGHIEANYRLWEIFRRVAKEFEEADAAKIEADKEYDRTKQAPWLVHSALERRIETGVVLLMTAAALLEKTIYDYACTFLEPDSYEEHLENMRIVAKWLLLPRLCQNKEIKEDDPTIGALKELIKARNSIVHHRRRDFLPDLRQASDKVSGETSRFLSACRRATSIVDALVKILESPPPGAKTAARLKAQ